MGVDGTVDWVRWLDCHPTRGCHDVEENELEVAFSVGIGRVMTHESIIATSYWWVTKVKNDEQLSIQFYSEYAGSST